jgi:hypothetical protein
MRLRFNCLILLLGGLVSCDRATDPFEPPIINPPEDPITLCSGACAGLDLVIDSLRVVIPGGRSTAFSGDTVAVVISITNHGTEASDSAVSIRLDNLSNAGATQSFEPLRAGATRVVTVPVAYPMFSRSARTRDSMFVEVSRFGENVPFGYQFHDEKITASYPFAGTTMRLEGTPPLLRFPSSDYEVRIIINNPSPRTITADSLTLCVFDIDYCFLNNIKSGFIPAVGPGQSLTLPFRLDIRMNENQSTPDEVRGPWDLLVCHGRRNNATFCTSQKTTIVPDYEKFCTTLPVLLPGNTLTIENQGRCGRGPFFTGLEMVAIDVLAGRTYTLNVSASGLLSIDFRTADTKQFAWDVQGGNFILRPDFSGRLYVFLPRAWTYTLQLAQPT